MEAFFNSILSISGNLNQETEKSGIRATFDWKEMGDVEKTNFVRRDVPDSFEGFFFFFLQIIHKATCWDTKRVYGRR